MQLISKTALKSTNNFDRYLKELDYNFKVLRDASVKHQDNAALERYEKSVQKEPEPLSIGKYVLRSQHSPPFQEKLRIRYTGPYRVTQKLRPDFYEILDLVQDQTENVHRLELLPVNCDNDDMASPVKAAVAAEAEELAMAVREKNEEISVMRAREAELVETLEGVLRKYHSLERAMRLNHDNQKRRAGMRF